ncbi:hypothetical protein KSP40_PGU016993 [Platanthera guangdongensis]|uniref:Uncharacterized protein n=1 Tax=Platanthera guangdongensis TaxID=2320717 RepID=A0ABR2LQF1_9ASPA
MVLPLLSPPRWFFPRRARRSCSHFSLFRVRSLPGWRLIVESAVVCDQKTEFHIVRDWTGFQQVLRVPCGASAWVCLYGEQIISKRNERDEELFFTSCKVLLNTCYFIAAKCLKSMIKCIFLQFMRPPGAMARDF